MYTVRNHAQISGVQSHAVQLYYAFRTGQVNGMSSHKIWELEQDIMLQHAARIFAVK